MYWPPGDCSAGDALSSAWTIRANPRVAEVRRYMVGGAQVYTACAGWPGDAPRSKVSSTVAAAVGTHEAIVGADVRPLLRLKVVQPESGFGIPARPRPEGQSVGDLAICGDDGLRDLPHTPEHRPHLISLPLDISEGPDPQIQEQVPISTLELLGHGGCIRR